MKVIGATTPIETATPNTDAIERSVSTYMTEANAFAVVDAASFEDDVVYARSRNAQRPGKRVGAHAQGLEEFLAQHLSGMNRAHAVPWGRDADVCLHVCLSAVIGDLHVEDAVAPPDDDEQVAGT